MPSLSASSPFGCPGPFPNTAWASSSWLAKSPQGEYLLTTSSSAARGAAAGRTAARKVVASHPVVVAVQAVGVAGQERWPLRLFLRVEVGAVVEVGCARATTTPSTRKRPENPTRKSQKRVCRARCIALPSSSRAINPTLRRTLGARTGGMCPGDWGYKREVVAQLPAGRRPSASHPQTSRAAASPASRQAPWRVLGRRDQDSRQCSVGLVRTLQAHLLLRKFNNSSLRTGQKWATLLATRSFLV